MKIKVTMKTPDALDYALKDAFSDYPIPEDGEDMEYEAREKLAKWFRYGECLTVEFDTEAMTATVLPAK